MCHNRRIAFLISLSTTNISLHHIYSFSTDFLTRICFLEKNYSVLNFFEKKTF